MSSNDQPQWPADKVERRLIASLTPDARNARTHSEDQVKQIAESMREWGWTNPVLLDEHGKIIAGHGRVLAAPLLGWTEAPCMVAVGWSDAKKRAYAIADNKLALNSGWDRDILRQEFEALAGLDFKIELIGFTPAEIDFVKLGWEAANDPRANDPSHLRGILHRISVFVAQEKIDAAKKVIADALNAAGIAFEQ